MSPDLVERLLHPLVKPIEGLWNPLADLDLSLDGDDGLDGLG